MKRNAIERMTFVIVIVVVIIGGMHGFILQLLLKIDNALQKGTMERKLANGLLNRMMNTLKKKRKNALKIQLMKR